MTRELYKKTLVGWLGAGLERVMGQGVGHNRDGLDWVWCWIILKGVHLVSSKVNTRTILVISEIRGAKTDKYPNYSSRATLAKFH